MQTKLTLRMDDALIERAKRYGQARGKSVSQLVAKYFALLEQHTSDTDSLPPLTRSLKGVISGTQADEKDYAEHLRKKHLGA